MGGSELRLRARTWVMVEGPVPQRGSADLIKIYFCIALSKILADCRIILAFDRWAVNSRRVAKY